jgi:Protein of unknown function (DUF2848)
MSSSKTFHLAVDSCDGSRPLAFTAKRLICCGWVGKDRVALQAHIDELAHLGVAPPTRVPIYMNLSTYLIATHEEIEVVSPTTSGEIEYVLLCDGRDVWVTVGSDQTDRDVETKSIVASKQMCGKVIATRCWPYSEVRDHWDELVLQCRITKDGQTSVYQESALAAILSPDQLLQNVPQSTPDVTDGLVLFSGTIATKAGLIFGDAYELVLRDPVLDRTIHASYRVSILTQHL